MKRRINNKHIENMIKKVHPLLVFFLGYIFCDLIRTLKFFGFIFDTKFSLIFFDIFSLILMIALCVSIMIYFMKFYSFSEFLIKFKEEKKILIITLGLVLVSFVLIVNLGNFETTILNFHVYILKINYLSKLSFESFSSSFSFLFLTLICFPVIEEVLYRGILQKYLLKLMNMKYSLIPIILVSLAFSIMHWQFSKIIVYFLCGLLYGYIYYKSKKIIFPIIVHSFWNLLSVLFSMDLQPMNRGNSFFLLIFIVVFLILANSLCKINGKQEVI